MNHNSEAMRHAAASSSGRMRSFSVVGVAAVAGIALGLGASSLALWKDSVSFDGQISSGYEYFAAGPEGGTITPASDEGAPPTGNSVDVTIGAAQAATLAADGEVAVVFQTDSLSQGNKGLAYTLAPPADWGSGYFGNSDVEIYWVASPAQCDPEIDPATPPSTVSGYTSTPVSADYSDTATVTTEYWCLVATLGDLPDEGTYKNTVTATGTDQADTEVSDTDDWSANVTTALDPANEDDHTITFQYGTFRPGQEP